MLYNLNYSKSLPTFLDWVTVLSTPNSKATKSFSWYSRLWSFGHKRGNAFIQSSVKYCIIKGVYNIINPAGKKYSMGDIHILGKIGLAFFFFKFYVFIGSLYILNFFMYIWQILWSQDSKTVICPYKKAHQHVFVSIGIHFAYLEEFLAM